MRAASSVALTALSTALSTAVWIALVSGLITPAPAAGSVGLTAVFGAPAAGSTPTPPQEAAQSRVVSVSMEADASAGETAVVTIAYELDIADGTDRVPFTVVAFEPTTVGAITAALGEEPLEVGVTDPGPLRVVGEARLSAPAGRGVLSLRLRYRVSGAVRSDGAGARVVLPVVAVDWPPAEALPGTFTATVELPDGTSAREVFPTYTGAPPPDGIALASLQVVPSLVQVRAYPLGSAAFSLPQALELLVLLVVVSLGMVGLRFLRSTE